MKILVLTINYAPETSGFSPHVAAACEHFARQGHQVRVVTGFPFAPFWKRWPGYEHRWVDRSVLNGVELVRIRHFVPSKPGHVFSRLWMEGSYCLMLIPFIFAWLLEPWDVVFYVGAQPSIAMVARIVSFLYRVPYAININDLAAEAAENVGIVKGKWLLRFFARFEFCAYRRAGGAMVLADSFRVALMRHGFAEERIELIRSPIDLEEFRPLARDSAFREKYSLRDDAFVLLFAGSMGLKQDMQSILNGARRLRESHPKIRWLLVGDGEQKAAVEKQIEAEQLQECVRLLPFQRGGMAELYAMADVLLLCQLSTVKDSVIPSKLLTYMAAGRPVLAMVNATSQGAELLRGSTGGWLVCPEDPAALAAAAVAAEQSPRLDEMGRNNRRYALAHFDQRKITAAQEAHLMRVVQEHTSR